MDVVLNPFPKFLDFLNFAGKILCHFGLLRISDWGFSCAPNSNKGTFGFPQHFIFLRCYSLTGSQWPLVSLRHCSITQVGDICPCCPSHPTAPQTAPSHPAGTGPAVPGLGLGLGLSASSIQPRPCSALQFPAHSLWLLPSWLKDLLSHQSLGRLLAVPALSGASDAPRDLE